MIIDFSGCKVTKVNKKNFNQLTFAGSEFILQILRLEYHFPGFMATLHSLLVI